jgi:hypothetical protein
MSVTGAIKVLDVPDDACLTTMRDLVLQLEKYLAVEFEEEKITNVVVSAVEPDTTSRDVLWFRIDSSGNPIGLYAFTQGVWYQEFPPPQQVIRMYGRSDEVPPRYALLDESIAGIPAGSNTAIRENWVLHPDQGGNPGIYIVFEVVKVGL